MELFRRQYRGWASWALASFVLGCTSATTLPTDEYPAHDGSAADGTIDDGSATTGDATIDGGDEADSSTACDTFGACTPGQERLNSEGCDYSYRVEECDSECLWQEKFPCGGGCGEHTPSHWDEERVCVYRGETMWGCSPTAPSISSVECTDTYPGTQNVRLTKSFWIDRYAVTVRRAREVCLEGTYCVNGDAYMIPDDHPLKNTWFDGNESATGFCEALGGRLPTEAEWMRAASGETKVPRARPWGDGWSCEEGHPLSDCDPILESAQTQPVNGFPLSRSPFGADLMLGGWKEFTSTRNYQIPWSSETLVDPIGPSTGSPIVKGNARYQSSSVRELVWRYVENSDQYYNPAFRCVYDL
jgi:hypothetical protein